MNVDSRFLTAALNKTLGECKAANPVLKLRDTLQARADAQFSLVSSGSIKEVGANSQRVAFETSDGRTTPDDVLYAWTYLVENFDRAFAALGGTPTDDAVAAQMRIYFRPVTGYTTNFMFLSK